MATIVRRTTTDEHFVLLGTGLGAYMAAKPHWLFGRLGTEEDSDVLPVVAVATAEGEVRWVAAEEIEVVSVDGQRPRDLIRSAGR